MLAFRSAHLALKPELLRVSWTKQRGRWVFLPRTHCVRAYQLDFGQNLNRLAIIRGGKYRVHQFPYCHGQAETIRKIAVVSAYPANALSPALSKLAKVELSSNVKSGVNPMRFFVGAFSAVEIRSKSSREMPATVSLLSTRRSRTASGTDID